MAIRDPSASCLILSLYIGTHSHFAVREYIVMNRNRYLAKSLILASLGFTSIQASASGAVFFASETSVQRLNTAGTSFAVLQPHATNFCYLSRVGVVETDTGSERAQCSVRRSGTVWLLEGFLGTSSDADVFCTAVCYRH